jgi:hypothetical protein
MNSAPEDDQFACLHNSGSRESLLAPRLIQIYHLVSKFDKTFRESVYKFIWPDTLKGLSYEIDFENVDVN